MLIVYILTLTKQFFPL